MLVAGARPNFMKLAPVVKSFSKFGLNSVVIHTGQHYDHQMSKVFFDELDIPKPDENLGVGSSSHAKQTAEIMISFEKICKKYHPWMVIVFGDVNSTIACALVARKLGILVSHVEAGLRSGDQEMPEEINRILTDHVSNYHFTTSAAATENLLKEGISSEKIFLVGNVMIDTLSQQMKNIKKSNIIKNLSLEKKGYDLLTLHRPSNVDNKEKFLQIISNFESPTFSKQIVFPAHPRTIKKARETGLLSKLKFAGIRAIDPLGYHDFLSLISNARSVWTDSGGIQEETSWLGVPCFTIRENTERPETIDFGTNILVSLEEGDSFEDIFRVHMERTEEKTQIEFWDGNSSKRITEIIIDIREKEDC